MCWHYQHPSVMSDPLNLGDHELVSNSMTIATLPLLVITRRRSGSLSSEISDAHEKKSSTNNRLKNSYKSNSFDSLNLGKIQMVDPKSPQTVPRIIVISPTTESGIIKADSVHLEDSFEALESNVFVSLNFSSEVFEAVELLSWPAGSMIPQIHFGPQDHQINRCCHLFVFSACWFDLKIILCTLMFRTEKCRRKLLWQVKWKFPEIKCIVFVIVILAETVAPWGISQAAECFC